jgi:cytochrome P450
VVTRIVGNAYKLGFWLLSHLAHNPNLLETIRQEVLPAVSGDAVHEEYLLERCPKLDSLAKETLRLTVISSLGRGVTEDTVVGGKLLRKGNKVMVLFIFS